MKGGPGITPGPCPAGIASCGGRSDERVVFVTGATGSAAAIGGITGADARCNAQALAAGLRGTYKAWLADSTTASAPYHRFEHSAVPYVRVDGARVADNWTDLTDGTLTNPIRLTETGYNDLVSGISSVRTNVTVAGVRWSATNHCTGWTGAAGAGAVGQRDVTNSLWTEANLSGYGCASHSYLHYCFEQPGTPPQTQIVPSGLTGYWRLDDQGETSLYDSTGNGNNGTMTGANTSARSVEAPVARGINIGNDSCITLTQSNTLFPTPGAWSVALWFNATSITPTAYADRLFSVKRGASGTSGSSSSPYLAAGQLGYLYYSGATATDVPDVHAINTGMWYHFAVTYNGSLHRVYLNGQLVGSYAGSTPAIGSHEATIGCFNVANPDEFNGLIDDFQIYNRVITQQEVTEIYQAQGAIRYNENYRSMEYSDGTRWVSMTREWPELTDGLMGHWKLNETTGTIAYDSSGNGRNGTMAFGLNAANESVRGAVGTALKFNAPDDMIQVPDFLGAQPSASIAAWVRKSEDVDGYQFYHIAGQASHTNQNYMFSLIYEKDDPGDNLDYVSFNVNAGSGTVVPYAATPDRGQWFHVAGTYDGANARLYINGVLQATEAVTGNLTNSNNVFTIGRKWDSAVYPAGAGAFVFDGAIDDVRVYSRALSLDEVGRLYNMGAPAGLNTALPQGCPVAGDTCDDGSVYVGLSPDGNVSMYAAPADESSSYIWGSHGTSRATNWWAGYSNTMLLQSYGQSAHPAAYQCAQKSFGGATDWYLPSENETTVLYNGGSPLIPAVKLGGSEYWTSTQHDGSSAKSRRFSGGGYSNTGKNGSFWLRCVRKGPAPRCLNPYGLEGQMIYNQAQGVVQYCDGARWIGIGR